MSWPKHALTLTCIKLTAQEQLSHQLQRENRSLLTPSCLQQAGVVRAPLPKILDMSYGIIAVNAYDVLFQPDLLTILLLFSHLKRINSSAHPPPPPRANPRALAFFEKIGRIARGGDEKRRRMPRPRDRRLPTLLQFFY